jgi:hypothetical protein
VEGYKEQTKYADCALNYFRFNINQFHSLKSSVYPRIRVIPVVVNNIITNLYEYNIIKVSDIN